MCTFRALAHALIAGVLAQANFATPVYAAAAATIKTSAQLHRVGDAPAGTVTYDPTIYGRFSIAAGLSGDADHPHLGAAVTYGANTGPQVEITGLHVALYSLSAQVYDRIQVQVQFWDQHNAATTQVFSIAPPASLVQVDMTGPYILDAGTSYDMQAELPKPVLLDGYQSTGIAVHVLASPSSSDPLAEQSDLVVAYNIDATDAMGTDLADYAEQLREDFNFAPTDAYAQALAIEVYGRPWQMVECGDSWNGYSNQLIEEFGETTVPQHWSAHTDGVTDGTIAFDGNSMTLDAGASSPQFPYYTSLGTPIPPSGEFSVRWRAKYLTLGPAGTGSLIVSQGVPAYPSAADDVAPRAAWVWQDTGGFHAQARTNTDSDPAPAYSESAGAVGEIHDIEYCWLNSSIEIWVDGQLYQQAARDPNVPRPDSLWIGNPVTSTGGHWNDVELYRVHVRKPFSDEIFASGFE